MFKILTISIFNKFLFALALISVILSFSLEYVFSFTPCKLCLYQRYLWILLFFVCLLNLTINKDYLRNSLLVTMILLTTISFLSFYHSGIELGFFNNIISCVANQNILANSLEELDYIIRNTKNSNCAFPKVFLLKLSLSNLSFILSSLLLLISLKIYKKYIFKKYVVKKN